MEGDLVNAFASLELVPKKVCIGYLLAFETFARVCTTHFREVCEMYEYDWESIIEKLEDVLDQTIIVKNYDNCVFLLIGEILTTRDFTDDFFCDTEIFVHDTLSPYFGPNIAIFHVDDFSVLTHEK